MKGEPTKADMLQYLTCWLCKGVYRDAHTINECMCTCKFFLDNPNRNKCPVCHTELGGKPLESVVKDQTLQNIVDSLIPDFKERDDCLKTQLLRRLVERRIAKGTYKPPAKETSSSQLSQSREEKSADIQYKLVPLAEEDLGMGELPKKLKVSHKNKTIMTIKRHLHNALKEPIDNIEILCKNFPVADSHCIDYVRKTKWGNSSRTMVLQYRRKRKIVGNVKQEPMVTE